MFANNIKTYKKETNMCTEVRRKIYNENKDIKEGKQRKINGIEK
jgi:hypothetical protein